MNRFSALQAVLTLVTQDISFYALKSLIDSKQGTLFTSGSGSSTTHGVLLNEEDLYKCSNGSEHFKPFRQAL
jgi:hypothetical protein